MKDKRQESLKGGAPVEAVVAARAKKVPVVGLFGAKGRVKIIKILADAGELNISEIARRAKLNHNATKAHLSILVGADVVQQKDFGRIRVYRFRIEIPRVLAIKKLFEMWEPSDE